METRVINEIAIDKCTRMAGMVTKLALDMTDAKLSIPSESEAKLASKKMTVSMCEMLIEDNIDPVSAFIFLQSIQQASKAFLELVKLHPSISTKLIDTLKGKSND